MAAGPERDAGVAAGGSVVLAGGDPEVLSTGDPEVLAEGEPGAAALADGSGRDAAGKAPGSSDGEGVDPIALRPEKGSQRTVPQASGPGNPPRLQGC